MIARDWCGTEEPGLEAMLQDPLVHMVMARDGISAEEVRSVARRAAVILALKQRSTLGRPADPLRNAG